MQTVAVDVFDRDTEFLQICRGSTMDTLPHEQSDLDADVLEKSLLTYLLTYRGPWCPTPRLTSCISHVTSVLLLFDAVYSSAVHFDRVVG